MGTLISILDLVRSKGLDPGRRKAATKGGEYHMPCPRCHGKDRFHIWPNQGENGGTWWCRECGKAGDVIEFLRYFDGLSYGEACDRLGLERAMAYRKLPTPPCRHATECFSGVDRELPSAQWLERAARLAEKANAALLENEKLLAWLKRRGIGLESVTRYRLGWLAGDDDNGCYYRPRSSWGLPEVERKKPNGKTVAKKLWIPRGLVIPTLKGEEVVSLRIRRPEADLKSKKSNKYYIITGSALLPMTAVTNNTSRIKTWVIVESQLDAITIAEQCGNISGIGALAMLSNTGKPCPKTHQQLLAAEKILVALDYDQAGQKGSCWWESTYPQAERWPVPLGKDPGEAVAQGVELAQWIADALPPSIPGPSAGSAGISSIGSLSPRGNGDTETAANSPTADTSISASKSKQECPPETCRHDLATFRHLLAETRTTSPSISSAKMRWSICPPA
ncbi:hypothetical protein C4J81_16310 [Deltaproteobacteria bacterium Smac51]|nr:hypothetical protein C4J81_16310 [Deltaproteobacteria bacterium Smac51]